MNLGHIYQAIILKGTVDLTSYFVVITITILLNRLTFHFFYKEILIHMLELKQLYGYYQEQDLVLFNNREILINGKPFYYNEGHLNGIFSIRDVLNDEGKFLSNQSSKNTVTLSAIFFDIFKSLQQFRNICEKRQVRLRLTTQIRKGQLYILSVANCFNKLTQGEKQRFLLAYYKKVCN